MSFKISLAAEGVSGFCPNEDEGFWDLLSPWEQPIKNIENKKRDIKSKKQAILFTDVTPN